MKPTTATLPLLAFGVLALVGLILLAAIGQLDDATRTTLAAVVSASLVGAGVSTIPHAQPTTTVVDVDPATPPANLRAGV